MKKVLAILILLNTMLTVYAQPPIRIPGAKKTSPTAFDNSWKLFSKSTGYNNSILITASVSNDPVKGKCLSFVSSQTNMVAEIILLNDANLSPDFSDRSTYVLKDGEIYHNLYLQLGEFNLASGQRFGYLIYFHKKDSQVPLWICTYSPVK